MDLFSGAIGTLLGVVATTALNQFTTRPRLSLSVFDIELTPYQPTDTKGVAEEVIQRKAKDYLATPPTTLELFARHDWLSTPPTEYQHPLLFTWNLYEANRDNELLRLNLRKIPPALKELRTYLQTNQQGAFCQCYSENQDLLWSHIHGETRRGNKFIDLSDPPDKPYLLERYFDNEGNIYINLGRKNIVLKWSDERIYKSALEATAKSLSAALCQWDVKRLDELLGNLERAKWSDSIYAETAEHIDRMLLKHSRVIIRGALTNSGRTGASVLGVGNLRLSSKGFILNRGAGTAIQEDIVAPIHLIRDDRVTVLPVISVPPGSAVPFVASSDWFLYNSGVEEELIQLYGSERLCQMTMISADGGPLASQQLVFGPNKALAAARG